MLVRQFKGVGRIRRASGTNDAKVFRQYEAAIQDLFDTGNLNALIALKEGQCSAKDLYMWWRDKTRPVPWEADNSDLFVELNQWLDNSTLASTTVVGYRKCIGLLKKHTKTKHASVSDIPQLLEKFRLICAKATPPKVKTFNQTRAVALSFLRKRTGDKQNPVYLKVKNIDVLAENPWTKQKVNNPLLPSEIDAALMKCDDKKLKDVIWFLCLTGMTPKEFLEDGWEIDDKINAVRIFGRKRSGRYARLVPKVYQKLTASKEYSYRQLLEAFKQLFPERNLYDLRRTYAVWNNRAGIEQLHTKAYMGHGSTMTEKYMAQNVASWLLEDAAKLANYIAAERTTVPDVSEQRMSLPDTPEQLTKNLHDERLAYFRELLDEQLTRWYKEGKMRRHYRVDRLIERAELISATERKVKTRPSRGQ
jgi:hypothetical protein